MILFRHVKTGRLYMKEGPAFNKSDGSRGERMVVYKDTRGIRYVRGEREFNEKFQPVTEEL